MPLVVGTDEAGYAPNLGPLVIAATAWRVPFADFDFYQEFSEQVQAVASASDSRLFIADSKAAYRAGGPLTPLETAVLSLLAVSGIRPQRIEELLARVCGAEIEVPTQYAWNDDRLPRDGDSARINHYVGSLSEAFARKQVVLVRMAARLIFPEEFNRLVQQMGNKASVLSAATLTLVRELVGDSEDDCTIVCDRHGGRARYAGFIQEYLTEEWSHVVAETPACSSYGWSERGRRMEIHFRVGGESYLPTAAASMTAKYLRELMMAGWNGYWLRWDEGLRPTAGYPGDAKRFLKDVRPIMRRLGIQRECVWRSR